MKKIIKFIVICLSLVFVLYGVYWYIIHPNTYKHNTAVKNGDVIMGADGLVNVNKFEVFIKKVETNKSAKIRITAYSKEGYPIIKDLEYDGNIIKCTTDNTRNLYGRDRFRKYGEYTKISKNEINFYILIDETGKYSDNWIFQELNP